MRKAEVLAVVVVAVGMLYGQGHAEERSMKLDQVVVTATKSEKDPKDLTQSVTVITAEDIKRSGATTVSEAIRSAVAINVQEYGPRGAVNQISLRGSTSAQVLVLLDGRRLNSPRSGGFNLSDLPVPLDRIERIEIVRGASSALYGADAVGGVVNIITKRPEQQEAGATASAGSHGYDALTVHNAGKSDLLSYSLSASRETADGYRTNSDLAQTTVGGTIGFDLSPGSIIDLSVNYLGKENGVPGSTNSPSPQARQWTGEMVAGLGYTAEVTKELDVNVNAYYNRDRLAYKDPGAFFPEDSRHRVMAKGGEGRLSWLTHTWNVVTLGAEVRQDHIESNTSGEHTASLWAGYVQDEISIGDSFIAVVGARYDDHSVYGDKFSPRASFRYHLETTGTIIRAAAGKGFRAPTFNDLYWPDTGFTSGNPAVLPETSKDYEGSLEQPFGKRLILLVAGFTRKVKDLIDWQPDATGKWMPTNVGRAHIRGIEAESRLRIGSTLTWSVNYTYINPIDEISGEKIYSIPESQLKSSLNIALQTETNVYIEGRAVRRYLKPGEDEWRYFVLDGKITQTVISRERLKSEVFFGMNNILDRKYEVVRTYDFATDAHIGGYPMPPREIYGGISVQF